MIKQRTKEDNWWIKEYTYWPLSWWEVCAMNLCEWDVILRPYWGWVIYYESNCKSLLWWPSDMFPHRFSDNWRYTNQEFYVLSDYDKLEVDYSSIEKELKDTISSSGQYSEYEILKAIKVLDELNNNKW